MKPLHVFLLLVLWCCCCSTDKNNANTPETEMVMEQLAEGPAQVTEVSISGDENAYTFNVTIKSPDTGCSQYADWWEVIGLDGSLIYRRILTHSHVDEQPFTRSGGPVEISKNTEVYVRAHMNNTGYGSAVFKGSVEAGFVSAQLTIDFAKELETADPLPEGCAF